MIKNITNENIALKYVFHNNKEAIGISYTNFFDEIKDMYFANKPDVKKGNGYIGTSFAVKEEYIDNKRDVINEGEVNFFISYNGFVTPKGQAYLLDYFENNKEELKVKYNGGK